MENVFKIKTVEGLTDELFFDLCQANSELRMERDQHGTIIVMSPTGANTGNYNLGISAKIWLWNEESQLGYTFDSSAGFTLPNSAVRSPDLSWVAKERWERISETERDKFAPLCPDFVVEVRSKTDRLPELKAKMEEYRANGCRLGWLIDRQEKAVHIYRTEGAPEIRKGEPAELSGEDVLPGLVMKIVY
ncbi:Uma2 family endonuclease [Arundinibacter roseus]|uniref:Uma2 family endonuclease n=1 Tax=Arundinibacter roseus TaxID=2070510 RepID=A0A4R4K8W7_9BACT|nr:Uma2 family endonuclease [Arundinibacter roseus]TDB64194.1 Uma2 family endonuclease [Arundinibacter roseus]